MASMMKITILFLLILHVFMANCVEQNTTLTDESTKSQGSTKEMSVDVSLTKQSGKLEESSSTAENNLATTAADSESDSSNADELAISERKKGKKGGKKGKGCGR